MLYNKGEAGRTIPPTLSKQPKSKVISKCNCLEQEGHQLLQVNSYLVQTCTLWVPRSINKNPCVGVGIDITEK